MKREKLDVIVINEIERKEEEEMNAREIEIEIMMGGEE